MRIETKGIGLNVRVDGPEDGAPLVFANSLGTDLSLWDKLVPLLPAGLRIIRWDKRGHGASDVPTPPYSMGALISDAEAVCDALDVKDAVVVGISIGGMIGQGLAVKRLDLVRGLVLSNTAVKIGTAQMWADRIAAITERGMGAMAESILDRWFSAPFRNSPDVAPLRQVLLSTAPEGYAGCCAAIAGTDFMAPTSGLRLPVLAIAGSEDLATPPDLVRETAGLIPGSRFELLRKTGHLPCYDAPEAYARVLTQFLREVGHV